MRAEIRNSKRIYALDLFLLEREREGGREGGRKERKEGRQAGRQEGRKEKGRKTFYLRQVESQL